MQSFEFYFRNLKFLFHWIIFPEWKAKHNLFSFLCINVNFFVFPSQRERERERERRESFTCQEVWQSLYRKHSCWFHLKQTITWKIVQQWNLETMNPMRRGSNAEYVFAILSNFTSILHQALRNSSTNYQHI